MAYLKGDDEILWRAIETPDAPIEMNEFYDREYGPKGLSAKEAMDCQNFRDAMEKRVAKTPHSTAVVWVDKSCHEEGRLTYSELLVSAKHIANKMISKYHLRKGDKVALCFLPGLEFIPTMLACFISGIIAVPVYPPDPTKSEVSVPRFTNALENANCRLVLTHKIYREKVMPYTKMQQKKNQLSRLSPNIFASSPSRSPSRSPFKSPLKSPSRSPSKSPSQSPQMLDNGERHPVLLPPASMTVSIERIDNSFLVSPREHSKTPPPQRASSPGLTLTVEPSRSRSRTRSTTTTKRPLRMEQTETMMLDVEPKERMRSRTSPQRPNLTDERTESPLESPNSPSQKRGHSSWPHLPWMSVDKSLKLKNTEFQSEDEDPFLDWPILPDDLAFLQYTSGSTGDPKGVMVSHNNVLSNILVTPGNCDCSVFWIPQYHDMGLIGGILYSLLRNRICIGTSPASFLTNPTLFVEVMDKYRLRGTMGPNFGYELCAKKTPQHVADKFDLSLMQYALNGAEPVKLETIHHWCVRFKTFNPLAMSPVYGMAESTLIITTHLWDEEVTELQIDEREYRLKKVKILGKRQLDRDGQIRVLDISSGGSGDQQMMIVDEKEEEELEEVKLSVVGCGWPIDCEVAIVDEETHELQPITSSGEIWVRGRRVAHGYYGRPEATEECFHAVIKDGPHGRDLGGHWLRTGDVGFLHDGQVYVCGRTKDILIIGGKNFYPNDLEDTVFQSHGVVRPGCCAVFALEDKEGRELICCVTEVRSHQIKNMDYEVICDSISKAVRLNHEVKCSIIVLLPSRTIPKTTSGKIRRKQTKEDYLNGALQILFEKNYVSDEPSPILSDPALLIPILRCIRRPPLPEDGENDPASSNAEKAFITFFRLLVAQIVGADPNQDVHSNSAFLELGMTSVEQVELRQFLVNAFPSLMFEPMMLYDYGQINLLVSHILQQYSSQLTNYPVGWFAPVPALTTGRLSDDQQRKVLHFVFLNELLVQYQLPISIISEDENVQIRDLPHFLDCSPDRIKQTLIATMLVDEQMLDDSSLVDIHNNWTIREAIDSLLKGIEGKKSLGNGFKEGGVEGGASMDVEVQFDPILPEDIPKTTCEFGMPKFPPCPEREICQQEGTVPYGQYLIIGLLQAFFSLILIPGIGAVCLWPAFLYLEWLYGDFNYEYLFFADPKFSRYGLLFIGFPVALLIGMLCLVIGVTITKWLVIGKMKPRKIRVWSFYFLRWWVVKTIFWFYGEIVLMVFKQTLLHFFWLRAMGVQMPSGLPSSMPIWLTEFDLLEVGGGSDLDDGAVVVGYSVESTGKMSFDQVKIGNNCTLPPLAVVTAPDMMRPGEIRQPYVWHESNGSGEVAEEMGDEQSDNEQNGGGLNPFLWHIAKLVAIVVVFLLSSVPGLAVMPIVSLVESGDFSVGRYTGLVFILTALVILLLGELVMLVTVKRIFLPEGIKPGVSYPSTGWFMWRKFVVDRHFAFVSQHFLVYFQQTHLIVWLAKAMGMDIKNSVLLTNLKLTPELVDLVVLEENVFVGGSVLFSLKSSESSHGETIFLSTRLEQDTWIGTDCEIRGGVVIGENCKIAGRCVIEEGKEIPPNSLCLGVPVKIYHKASTEQFNALQGCGIQSIRFIKQVGGVLIILAILAAFLWPGYELVRFLWLEYDNHILSYFSLLMWYLIFQILKILFSIFGKWILIGRYNVTHERVTHLEPYLKSWQLKAINNSGFLALTLGSPLYNLYLRSLGMKIETASFIDTLYLFDPDMANVGSHCIVSHMSNIFCHSFEGEGMEFGPVKLEDYVILHPTGYVTRGNVMGHCSELLPGGFPLPGEQIGCHSIWGGVPARFQRQKDQSS